jgi:hypothetical protein
MNTDQNELRLNLHKREYWQARATKADKSDKVTITYPRSNNRFYSYTEVKGEREAVLDHTAYLISHSTCTLQYEHMLLTVVKIVEVNGETVALLSKNLYAGD